MSGAWSERLGAVLGGSDRTAVEEQSGPVSGRELLGRAGAAADLLASLATPGAVAVPALLTTNADALALLVGGAAADLPVAPLGARLTAAELAGPVRGTGSAVLLAEEAAVPLAEEVAALTGVRVVRLPRLRASAAPLPVPRGPVALYLHTAGTTGTPKRVPFSQDVLAARTALLAPAAGFGPESRYATGSPLHHIGGLGNTLAALSVGAAIVPTTRFTLDWWRSLASGGATHGLLVPSMIEMLLEARLLDAVGLRTLIYGASPISPVTLRRVLDLLPGVRLLHLFGQSEGSPITWLTPEDHARALAGGPHLLGSVGRPVTGLTMRLAESDEEGVGEVLAAAPHLSVHADDGWLHTGDLGRVDDEGYLYLVGRRNDMVIRGGENVYPVEVENVLAEHPGVAAAGVVGVPDRWLGETLAAFVVPADPARPPSADELHAHVRARLAGFKVPACWHTVAELPVTTAGKLSRRDLQREHADGSA
ncbi:class I adenylate-forming enzyme family protein [Trujillonella humicola]|uniref:class I adenylate-forming enzyme family protein n=1 Tax=Trujillonella humicola TaxID=3383699 RepID=UPI00390599EE